MSFNNFINLYKKIERLSSAIFLVSNTITDCYELKRKINDLAISLISYCAAIKDNITTEEIKLLSKMESALMEISSLLDMALVSGLVSSMNTSILKQEFDFLIKSLNELYQHCNEKTKISNNFFKNDNVNLALNHLPIVAREENFISTSHKNSQQIKEKSVNSRKEFRGKAIIDVIRMKGNASIKDISKSVKGCSEKTIQRKLFSLIQNGILKKNGERRWSKYSLVKIE